MINEIKIKISVLIDEAQARLRQFQNDLNNSGSGENKAKKALDDTEKSAGALGNTFNKVGADIKSMVAGMFAVGAAAAFVKKLVDTVAEIQNLRMMLSSLTKDAQDYANTEAYLTDLAHRHHKAVQDLASGYGRLLVMEQSGIITRQQSMQLLEGFSNAQSKTGATAVQVAQSLYGLSQMLGQGTVQAAEFNQTIEPMGDLGNRIAKSLGYDTTAALKKAIGEQKITSEMMAVAMTQALKGYEGAAARSAGTISASYADIGSAYTEMAAELEKPVATATLGVVDVGKSAYGWIKENGDAVITLLTAIAVVMAGKATAAIALKTQAGIQAIQVEQAHGMALVENAQREEAARLVKVRAAEAKALDRTATVQLTTANLALVDSDIRAEAATLALAATEAERAAIVNKLAALSTQKLAISTALTKATQSQAAAEQFLVQQNLKLAESQAAVTAASNASGVAVTRLGAAMKSAFAFVGGWVGVAVLALWGLYEVLNKVTGAEEDAERKSKAFAESLDLMHKEITKLNDKSVEIDFSKTLADLDAVNAKIKEIEQFSWSKLGNVGELSEQRANLQQQKELLEQRKAALGEKKNDLTANFDTSNLSTEQLNSELKTTQAEFKALSDKIAPLQAQYKDGLIGKEAFSADEVRLNALQSKLSALEGSLGKGSKPKAADTSLIKAQSKAAEKAITSEYRLKEQTLQNAREVAIAEAGKDKEKRLEIEKDFSQKSLQLTLQRIEAEKAAKIKANEGSDKKNKDVELQTQLADLENQRLAAINEAETKRKTLGFEQRDNAQELAQTRLEAQFDLEKSKIELDLAASKAEVKTALDELKRGFEQGGNSSGQGHAYQGGGKQDMMLGVFSAFQNAGFSANQAKALSAEVGRENDFNPRNVFGSHTDAANGATNTGFFSWQGSRSTELRQSLTEKGLMKDGKIEFSQESLNAMAAFAKAEMESGKYKGSSSFLANKNIGSEDAANQLGHGYIKWAMGQNVLKNGESFDWKKHDAKRAGYYNQIDALSGGSGGDIKQLEQQDDTRISQYYAKRKKLEDAGIAANIKAIQAKLSILDKEFSAKKKAAKDTPEKLPKIEADYQTEKAKLVQELGQLNSELLTVQKNADAEMKAEQSKAQAERIDSQEKADLEPIKLAEDEAQQQFELGNINHETLLQKQQQFEDQRYQIALKALQDRRALLDEGDLSGKAKSLAQEKSLTNKHAADLKAINHKMALDSQASFSSFISPIKSAFSSTVQGIIQGTTTLKQGFRNMAQSIALSWAQSLANMAIDSAAHWLWELLGFEAKETSKTVLKTTSEAAQTGATVVGTQSRVAAEASASMESKAIEASSATSKITTKAADAAAGAYDAMVGIPYVGPIIAPIAAAVAFAGVMAFGGMVSSSAGGEWNVPDDRLNFVHKNETILPATIAAPMREFFANGGMGNLSLPDSATNFANPANQGLANTAASALAMQQSLIMTQQKATARQSSGGTVVINTKGGDFIHKNDLAEFMKKENRNFRLA
jgi:tape measure domain-containing protein